jgi:spermidine/putrescine transport system permease protein
MESLSKSRRIRRRKTTKFFGDFYAILMYTVFYLPVAVMIAFSFNNA